MIVGQPNAWQPFGYGMRGCIVRSSQVTTRSLTAQAQPGVQGRPFAWHAVQLVLVSILQNFDLHMHDPAYELKLKQTLTIKPRNFYIHAIPRKNKPRLLAVPSSVLSPAGPAAAQGPTTTSTAETSKLQQMYILYGSNTGNSESFAQRLASDASAHGK